MFASVLGVYWGVECTALIIYVAMSGQKIAKAIASFGSLVK